MTTKRKLSESDLIKMDEKIINVGFVDPHQVDGGNERARQSSAKKITMAQARAAKNTVGWSQEQHPFRTTQLHGGDGGWGDGGTSNKYSRLERGTFCNALFIICMPNPETLPTNIAVRPMFDFRRSNKSTTEASVNNNINQRLLLNYFFNFFVDWEARSKLGGGGGRGARDTEVEGIQGDCTQVILGYISYI